MYVCGRRGGKGALIGSDNTRGSKTEKACTQQTHLPSYTRARARQATTRREGRRSTELCTTRGEIGGGEKGTRKTRISKGWWWWSDKTAEKGRERGKKGRR